MRSPLFRFSFALLCLGLVAVGFASSEGNNRWVRKLDDSWCLLFDANEICLPSEYGVKFFDDGTAKFRSKSIEARPLIEYESSRSRTPTEQIDSLLDDSLLVVGNTQFHGELTIVEVVPAISKSEEMHGVTIFILNFGDRFTLKIYGGNRVANENLARELFAQWSASADRD